MSNIWNTKPEVIKADPKTPKPPKSTGITKEIFIANEIIDLMKKRELTYRQAESALEICKRSLKDTKIK